MMDPHSLLPTPYFFLEKNCTYVKNTKTYKVYQIELEVYQIEKNDLFNCLMTIAESKDYLVELVAPSNSSISITRKVAQGD